MPNKQNKPLLRCLANKNNMDVEINEQEVSDFIQSCGHFVFISKEGIKVEFERVD